MSISDLIRRSVLVVAMTAMPAVNFRPNARTRLSCYWSKSILCHFCRTPATLRFFGQIFLVQDIPTAESEAGGGGRELSAMR